MKKNVGPKFVPEVSKSVQKLVFCHFLKFGWLVFLEIAYSDSLQRLTTSRGRTCEKDLCSKLCRQVSESVPRLGFLPFSQVWFVSFP